MPKIESISPSIAKKSGDNWDIDLIFDTCIWVYNDELQIKLTFRSGPMICGRVMALGLWNLDKYLVVTSFFRPERNVNLISNSSLYTHIPKTKSISPSIAKKRGDNSFRFNDLWPSYGPWTVKFCQIVSCHHFFSLCLEILTWFLIHVYECTWSVTHHYTLIYQRSSQYLQA
jgi:hypothetical protein